MARALSDIGSVRLIVGMEVHVELSTRTKVFSSAPNPAGAGMGRASPNTLIDPVVLGLPGALPVLGRASVETAIRVGLALGCTIAPRTRWDRKSYFYPDLPKGYQISQYDLPLCAGGEVEVECAGEGGVPRRTIRVGILRAHLEEDAGKLLHEAPGGAAIDHSIADYNRAGAPLLEVVTRPDLGSSEEAVAFCRTLRAICRFLGASLGVLQKGHMRFEPNINCELTLRDGRVVRTPIVEVKNLNSFRAVKGAIDAERRDQPARWVRTGLEHAPGTKQTRGFDERALGEAGGGPGSGGSIGGATVLQREKEDAHDYRYFPDPDLPVLEIDPGWVRRLAATVPELPGARARRYVEREGLSAKEAAALVEEPEDCLFFEAVRSGLATRGLGAERASKAAANLVLQSGLKLANERAGARRGTSLGAALDGDQEGDGEQDGARILVSALGISADQCAAIAAMREQGRISAAGADALFVRLCETGMGERDPEQEAAAGGLLIVRDEAAMDGWIARVLVEHGAIAEQVRAGKVQALGRLVGAAMKLSGGTGDARSIRARLLERLGVAE